MQYTWDDDKRTANLEKHGLDFLLAPLVHEAPRTLTMPARPGADHEVRWKDIAVIQGVALSLIYSLRQETVRCISLRKASRKERRMYATAQQERDLQ